MELTCHLVFFYTKNVVINYNLKSVLQKLININ